MTDSNLIHGEHYWASQAGVDDLRAILSAHPEIRYSMWSSSSEISEQTEEQVQRYLDTLDALGQEFPEVTFIYMTGHGDEEYNGVNRAKRNQPIRDSAAITGRSSTISRTSTPTGTASDTLRRWTGSRSRCNTRISTWSRQATRSTSTPTRRRIAVRTRPGPFGA
ncbi:hypothetical protein [Sorangium sp. So ce128]|uniref:hypothetical protein n=1 Tax=Sorangium sp. So ce128 TaxID=3133281 RepID=UPI003F61D60A